jgi:uncharacterized protein with HEPN domain
MSKRETTLYLSDIIEAICAVEKYLVVIDFAMFIADRKTYSATIRELEIIGEASTHLPEDFKQLHPEVPWRLMKDFRNVLSHHYFGVNFEIVWDVVQNQLPGIKKQITLLQAGLSKSQS